MGQATSRTRPSMVVLLTFARAPSIDVLCGGLDAANTIPQHASTQILNGRIIALLVYRHQIGVSPIEWSVRHCITRRAPGIQSLLPSTSPSGSSTLRIFDTALNLHTRFQTLGPNQL